MKRSTVSAKKRKIGLIFLGLFLMFVVIILYGFYLYFLTIKEKKNELKDSEIYVLENQLLAEIEQKEVFYEKETAHIFFGVTEDKEDAIVFVLNPFQDVEVFKVLRKHIIDEHKAMSIIIEECSSCYDFYVKPAMINNRALWEVTYRDEKERYNLDYISMEDGSRYERLQLKQMFK